MSRWYRAYEGTVTDAKLAEAALVAGCSRSVAIATWHAILENGASLNEGGRFDIPSRRVAAILCEPLNMIEAVFAALEAVSLVGDGVIVAWSKRQHESDSSTERSRKHRATKRNGDATLQQRDATPPETESETDKGCSNEQPKARVRARSPEVEIPEWMPADEWAAFRKMRKAMRQVPFTDDAERGIIADLARLRGEGHDPAKVLLKAVKRGWRGVFGDDDTKAKPGELKLMPAERVANLKKALEFYSRIGRQDDVRECRRQIAALEREHPPPPAVTKIIGEATRGMAA